MRRVTPKLSRWWWLDYIENPEPDCPSWNKGFRQRFRLPYWLFVEILEWVSGYGCGGLFDRWRTEADGYTGQKKQEGFLYWASPPRHAMVPWQGMYIRWYWRLYESKLRGASLFFFTRSRHLVRNFCTHGSYICRIRLPTCKIASPSTPWLGFLDVSEVPMRHISHSTRLLLHFGKPILAGCKMGLETTSRTYNLTVNHRRQILHTTTGHPGRWNDKTLIRFDTFMADLRDGAFDERINFKLKRGGKEGRNENENDDDEDLVTIKGAYIIVNNGYLRWPTTIPRMKDAFNRSEQRFSQWLELLR